MAVVLCNRALQRLGQPLILSLDDDTAAARRCSLAYPPARDALLTLYPWPFALKRHNTLSLPDDCLRVMAVEGVDEWRIEGRQVVVERTTSSVDVVYIARITEVEAMDPLFQECLTLRLAFDLSWIFMPSAAARQALARDLEGLIQRAEYIIQQQTQARVF